MSRYRPTTRSRPRPFWLPASTFYFLASAIAIAIFFLVLAVLNDDSENSPWIPAGLIASTMLIMSVAVREVILRYRRERIIEEQRRLDRVLGSVPVSRRPSENDEKLTLERNSAFIAEIKRRSEAAKVLGHIAESHQEVMGLCESYLELASRELASVGVGSPRLPAITRGRDKAERTHHYHTLKWAEIKLRSETNFAARTADPSQRLGHAREALDVLDKAIAFYPHDRKLLDSKSVIEELAISAEVALLIENAERSELSGDIAGARQAYTNAFDLLGSDARNDELLKRLAAEIDRMSRIVDG